MSLTILMYHYVRDLQHSRYPRIKGRSVEHFRQQLDYIAEHYVVVTAQDVISALQKRAPLPENALWLTFDDGYLEHFTIVFPELMRRGWQGSFFAPSQTMRDRTLLDVNKIHFILASQPDPKPILSQIRDFIEQHASDDALDRFENYWAAYGKPSRLDAADVAFIKRLLQHGLPKAPRTLLVDTLFSQYVKCDERVFAEELYMTMDQAKLMVKSGMYFGGHGASHCWMGEITAAEQENEVIDSLDLLRAIGAPTHDWIMCYPHGSYNDSLLQCLQKHHCAGGITTQEGIADILNQSPLLLTRFDTNSLPICEPAKTEKAIATRGQIQKTA